MGLTQWLSGKESTCNAGDAGDEGLTPGLGGSPGGEHGIPLQYSCLETWTEDTVHSVAKSQTQLKRLSTQPLL